MAMARLNSVRAQPNSSAIGIWNTPNEARIAKLTMMTMQPATRTGVTRGAARGMGEALLTCGTWPMPRPRSIAIP